MLLCQHDSRHVQSHVQCFAEILTDLRKRGILYWAGWHTENWNMANLMLRCDVSHFFLRLLRLNRNCFTLNTLDMGTYSFHCSICTWLRQSKQKSIEKVFSCRLLCSHGCVLCTVQYFFSSLPVSYLTIACHFGNS